MWIHHPDFPNVVKKALELEPNLGVAIKNFIESAKQWNRLVFGNLFIWKRRVLARLYGVQKALVNGPNQFLIQLERDLTEEYSAIMQQEEEFWALKSRLNWAAHGDRNTSFFHVSTLARRHRITDETGVKNFILLEYHKLFEIGMGFSTLLSDIEYFACCFLSEEDKNWLSTHIVE